MICILGATWLPGTGTASAQGDRDLFRDGREAVTKGRYQEALPLLQRYLRESPKGKHASRAGLFLGKTYLGLDDYNEARRIFQMTIDRYPESLEAHKSAYKLALIAYLEGKHAEAAKRFQAVAEANNGPLVPEAQAFLRLLKETR